LTASDLAQKIKTILEDKKAQNIDVIDVSDKTILADYFVIATGTSTTHVKALADEVEYMIKEMRIAKWTMSRGLNPPVGSCWIMAMLSSISSTAKKEISTAWRNSGSKAAAARKLSF